MSPAPDRRSVPGSALRRRARISAVLGLAAFSLWLLAAASASAFTVQGSVEQVDVTGLAPNAQASLLSKSGATVYTQEADCAGRPAVPEREARQEVPGARDLDGRNVGTDHASTRMPRRRGIPSIYNQEIPDNGYTYLTTRDGTKLAIDVHPPTSPAGEPGVPSKFHFPTLPIPGVPTVSYTPPVPDADRVLGLRVREPGRPGKRHRRARQPDGLRRRRREHARDRLLGRRLRLLRTAAEPRRLRRDRNDRPPAVGARQQGRHARHLLRRDQPAVHRADPARRPGGDRAAVDDRRDGFDALSRRHPQHRLRGRVGRTAPAERRTGQPRPRAGMGDEADRRRRSDLRGQPGAARRGHEPDGKDQGQRDLQPAGRRSARPGHVREEDQRADVHGLPVGGRADRRALRRSGAALHRHEPASGSRSPTAPTSTRSIRTRSTGCTTSSSCTSRTRRRSSTRRSSMPRHRSSTTKRWGCPKPTWSRSRRIRSRKS